MREYKCIDIAADSDDFTAVLNEAAADNWELHSFQVTGSMSGLWMYIVLVRSSNSNLAR